jgi:hypothetical protein
VPHQRVGVAVFSRTAVERNDFHVDSLLRWM